MYSFNSKFSILNRNPSLTVQEISWPLKKRRLSQEFPSPHRCNKIQQQVEVNSITTDKKIRSAKPYD